MGISRMTAWAIQGNSSVYADSGQCPESKKWAGFVCCIDAKDRPRTLLSTEAIYDSAKAAEKAMKKVISEVRKTRID